ncbi:DNA-binding protein [Enterococcus gallinarum]|uniref:DNA-binding protein n=1 Tax=Enterococcus gallinarum TaxID=1353 RepID=UPI00391A7D38
MLERYIEKCVIRQVYLCEQLYEKESMLIDRLAEQLDVCPATIINDIDKILLLLKERIATATHEKHTYQVVFTAGSSLSELTQTIYQGSYFLQVLYQFLIGERSWQKISEEVFISLSKVYTIRTDLWRFFEEMGYLNEEQEEVEIPEKDFRYLLLAVMNYLGKRPEKNQSFIEQACEELIQFVEQRFFLRSYPEDERQIIHLGIRIGLARSRRAPICFASRDKEMARQTPLFQLLQQGLKELVVSLCSNEDEEFYIYSLFNSRKYQCNNLELLQRDFEVVYRNHIHRCPEMLELTHLLQNRLGISEKNHLLFEKALLPFLRSAWGDMQIFQTDRLFFLYPSEREMFDQIMESLGLWANQNQQMIRWNDNLVRKLTILLSLLPDAEKTEHLEVYIVAPSDFKYLYYRQQLEEMLDEHFTISNMIYHQLTDVVDDVFFCTKRMILCDASLYQETLQTKNTKIYPVTFSTVSSVILAINQTLYQRVEEIFATKSN